MLIKYHNQYKVVKVDPYNLYTTFAAPASSRIVPMQTIKIIGSHNIQNNSKLQVLELYKSICYTKIPSTGLTTTEWLFATIALAALYSTYKTLPILRQKNNYIVTVNVINKPFTMGPFKFLPPQSKGMPAPVYNFNIDEFFDNEIQVINSHLNYLSVENLNKLFVNEPVENYTEFLQGLISATNYPLKFYDQNYNEHLGRQRTIGSEMYFSYGLSSNSNLPPITLIDREYNEFDQTLSDKIVSEYRIQQTDIINHIKNLKMQKILKSGHRTNNFNKPFLYNSSLSDLLTHPFISKNKQLTEKIIKYESIRTNLASVDVVNIAGCFRPIVWISYFINGAIDGNGYFDRKIYHFHLLNHMNLLYYFPFLPLTDREVQDYKKITIILSKFFRGVTARFTKTPLYNEQLLSQITAIKNRYNHNINSAPNSYDDYIEQMKFKVLFLDLVLESKILQTNKYLKLFSIISAIHKNEIQRLTSDNNSKNTE